MTRIAVFGTRDIAAERPLWPGQTPVHEERGAGGTYRWYSTGKLEQALAEGYEVYVVSIRPAFGPHDDWWRRLVDPERVFVNAGLMSAFTGGDVRRADRFDAWRRFYERVGLRWSDDFDDLDDPRLAAIAADGIVDGSTFRGRQYLN